MVARSNTADDQSLQLVRLKELREVRDRVSHIIAELPDISTFDPTSTHEEIRKGENSRRMLLLRLDAVQVRLNNLERRAGLPVTIGVIGQMNAGKSSLLNHLIATANQGVLPKALEREVGNTAIDTRLTYITHKQYVERFNCDEVTVASATSAFLKRLNFIDTPGTGWSELTDQVTIDLLSAADVILFVFKPTSTLDALSTKMLYLKHARFDHIPLLYVATDGFHYSSLRDWPAVDMDQFRSDLSEAHAKLRERSTSSDAELQARDIVCRNTRFVVGTNTFLVDSRHLVNNRRALNVDALYRVLLRDYASPQMLQRKRSAIDQSIDDIREELGHIVTDARKHSLRMRNLLHSIASTRVTAEIGTFIEHRIASELARFQQQQRSTITSAPLPLAQPAPIPHLPLNPYVEPPSVTLLNHQFRAIQGRSGQVIEQAQVDVEAIRIHIDCLWAEIKSALARDVDFAWRKLAPRIVMGQRFGLGDSDEIINTQTVSQLRREVERVLGQAAGLIRKKTAELRRQVAEDIQLLAARLRNDETAIDSVLHDQRRLLGEMQLHIPGRREKALAAIAESKKRCEDFRRRHEKSLDAELKEFVDDLHATSKRHVQDNIYTPARIAVSNVLGDAYASICNTDVRFELDGSNLTEADAEFTNGQQQAVLEGEQSIEAAYQRWEAQYAALEAKFLELAGVSGQAATTILQALDSALTSVESAIELLAKTIELEFRSLSAALPGYSQPIRELAVDALSSVQGKRRAQTGLQVIGAIASVAAPIVGFYQDYYKQNPWVFLAAALVCAGFLAWTLRALVARKHLFEQLVQKEYRAACDIVLADVARAMERVHGNVLSAVKATNDNVSKELNHFYDKVRMSSAGAAREIIPALHDQISEAARLGVRAAESLVECAIAVNEKLNAMTRGALKARYDRAIRRVNGDCRTSINRSGEVFVKDLNELSGTFRDVEARLSDLEKRLQRGTVASR